MNDILDLKCGDCLELMKSIPDGSIDMVLCDPPYGIDYQSQWKRDKSKWKPKIIGDKTPFLDFIPEITRILKPSGTVFIFTRWDVQQSVIDCMTASGMKPKAVIIWDKVVHGMGDLRRAPGSRYESIVYFAGKEFSFPRKRPTDIVRVQRVNAQKLIHPNEKPIELLEYIVETYSNPGALVLDNCMGSGSTGVACVNTGRNFIGFELDKQYFDNAQKRIEEAVNHRKEDCCTPGQIRMEDCFEDAD